MEFHNSGITGRKEKFKKIPNESFRYNPVNRFLLNN